MRNSYILVTTTRPRTSSRPSRPPIQLVVLAQIHLLPTPMRPKTTLSSRTEELTTSPPRCLLTPVVRQPATFPSDNLVTFSPCPMVHSATPGDLCRTFNLIQLLQIGTCLQFIPGRPVWKHHRLEVRIRLCDSRHGHTCPATVHHGDH